MNLPSSDQFTVNKSRWLIAFSTIALAIITCVIAVALAYSKTRILIAFFPLAVAALLSAAYVKVWLRHSPICRIDHEGITDYGFFSQGFGLIRWHNIEGVNKFRDRSGTGILLKVNNFDELIERRNPLMRPLLFLNGRMMDVLGGQIYLPISAGDTDAETVCQKIHHYSANQTQLAPPLKLAQAFTARLAFMGYAALSVCAIAAVFVALYSVWQHVQSPSLKILGDDGNYGKEIGMQIHMGKQVWLQDYAIENFGQETNGLQLELSGKAFETGLLKNPRILIEYVDKSQIDVSYVPKRTRELVPLVDVKNRLWVGASKSAFLAHKDDMVVQLWQLFSNKLNSDALGWWTDPLAPCLSIDLFADVPKGGKGTIDLKVVPMAFPGSAVSMLTRVVSTTQRAGYPVELPSIEVPKDFPVTAYPDSQILSLADWQVKLDSLATPEAIAAYYKEELKRNGWKAFVKENKVMRSLVVEGTKGKRTISIEMPRIKHHTPIEITLDLPLL